MSADQDEGREKLLDIWAKLLTSAMAPKRHSGYRREFVDIAKQHGPINVLVMMDLILTIAIAVLCCTDGVLMLPSGQPFLPDLPAIMEGISRVNDLVDARQDVGFYHPAGGAGDFQRESALLRTSSFTCR